MENSFLDYAMSVIMSRALPDVRDGLKPVHRRIIWDMEQQGFRPDRPFVKCARVTGDTMARFHPHGDWAIYDALVRMAQPFSLRHPLIDFHGNYGIPDFGPAASRYTECRLHPLAMQLLADIDEDTVDMIPNYDGTTEQPAVLPARFPNLLVNGSQGIAVGMATNIPPHNLGEVIDATIHLLDHPELMDDPATASDKLMEFVKGPDFPTGGQILGRAGIIDAYRTGRGSVKMRAKAVDRGEQERSLRDRRHRAAVPDELLVDRRPHRGAGHRRRPRRHRRRQRRLGRRQDPPRDHAQARRQRQRRAQQPVQADPAADARSRSTWSPSSTACRARSTWRPALDGYIRHQLEVVTRRTEFRLDKARRREHILEGRIKALDVIDADHRPHPGQRRRRRRQGGADGRAVRVQRGAGRSTSSTCSSASSRGSAGSTSRPSSPTCAPASPSSRRSSPTTSSCAASSRTRCWRSRKSFATPRVCELTYDDGEMSIEDLVDDKELVIVMTEAQYVKAVPASAFKTQGRGGRGVSGGKLKADDIVRHVIFTTAHAHLLFFSNRGKVYRLRALDIPERERTAKGMPIVNLLPLQANEQIQAIIDTRDFAGERFIFFATRKGTVKKTAFDAYDSSRRDGIIAINLNDGDELVKVIETIGADHIFMVSRDGMTIRFDEDDVRAMGRSAAGVRGMKLKNGDDAVVSCDVARDDTAILIMTEAGYGKRTQLDKFNVQGRGGQGVRGIKLTGKKGHVDRRLHGRPRRRDRRRLVGRRHDPHGGPSDLVAGSRRHRRADHEPRRRPDRRQRGPDHRLRRRRGLSGRRSGGRSASRPCVASNARSTPWRCDARSRIDAGVGGAWSVSPSRRR